MSSSEPDRVLAAALRVFLASGFHAVTIDELESATGLSWDEARSRYIDKEGLFFAAIEYRLDALSAGATGPGELEAIAAMLRRVSGAGSNVMLRAQHREVLQRLTRLGEAAAG